MDDVKEILNGIDDDIKTLYNIGVGHEPHNEAKLFKNKFPNIKIIGLEPNPETFNNRKETYVGDFINKGLWSENKELEFYMAKDYGRSSFLEADESWAKRKKVEIVNKINVECITLDDLDQQYDYPKDIFLWMDVEGSELEVLKGGINLLKSNRLKYIDLEISIMKRRKNEPSENDIISFLSNFNYFIEKKYGSAETFRNYLIKHND